MHAPLGAHLSNLSLGSRLAITNQRLVWERMQFSFLLSPCFCNWQKKNEPGQVMTTQSVFSFKLCLIGSSYRPRSCGFLPEGSVIRHSNIREGVSRPSITFLSFLPDKSVAPLICAETADSAAGLPPRRLLWSWSSWSTVMVSSAAARLPGTAELPSGMEWLGPFTCFLSGFLGPYSTPAPQTFHILGSFMPPHTHIDL